MSRSKPEDVNKNIKTFIKQVESLEALGEVGFRREYALIQEKQIKNHQSNVGLREIGQLECNLKKNRYKDIVPYDDHRIVLSVIDGDQSTDYINASAIKGVTGTCDYIASQAPLSGTVNDFWRMIWEYKIEIVFMACRLIEMKKIKCTQYWSSLDTPQQFGDITVFTESEEEIMTECVRRKLRATKGDEVHYVTQFQYCGWPDHGIPENLSDIHELLAIMRDTRNQSQAPWLIHCSAGCGRTGAIIAIDYAWTLLEEGKFDETFSLFNLICDLREQRVSLVQTPDQYAFVNKILKFLCEEWLTKISAHTYENVDYNQEHSSEKDEQTSEESVYEDIWSLPKSQQKTSVQSPKEFSITDERYLGRSNDLIQMVQTEENDDASLYANMAEIKRKLQEEKASNNEQPSGAANNEQIVHRTFIRVNSISTSQRAQRPVETVKELPAASPATTSERSNLNNGNPLVSTVNPREANHTGIHVSSPTTTITDSAISSQSIHITSSAGQSDSEHMPTIRNNVGRNHPTSDSTPTEKPSKPKTDSFLLPQDLITRL